VAELAQNFSGTVTEARALLNCMMSESVRRGTFAEAPNAMSNALR
jgi:hypothetical protein